MTLLAAIWDAIQAFLKTILYSYIAILVSLIIPPKRKCIQLFEGEIALVTGTGHGIGRELALELSKLGAIVVVWDVNKTNSQRTAQEIKSSGGKAYVYMCDINRSQTVSDVAKKVSREVGEVTILVNNTAILKCDPCFELTETDVRRAFLRNSL